MQPDTRVPSIDEHWTLSPDRRSLGVRYVLTNHAPTAIIAFVLLCDAIDGMKLNPKRVYTSLEAETLVLAKAAIRLKPGYRVYVISAPLGLHTGQAMSTPDATREGLSP